MYIQLILPHNQMYIDYKVLSLQVIKNASQ